MARCPHDHSPAPAPIGSSAGRRGSTDWPTAKDSTTNGNLRLSFEANKSVGSVFVVQRCVKPIGQPAEDVQFKVTTAEKAWLDTGVPHGLEWVSYQVATKLTNNVLSDWSTAATFNLGIVTSVQTPASARQDAEHGPDGLTIDVAKAL